MIDGCKETQFREPSLRSFRSLSFYFVFPLSSFFIPLTRYHIEITGKKDEKMKIPNE